MSSDPLPGRIALAAREVVTHLDYESTADPSLRRAIKKLAAVLDPEPGTCGWLVDRGRYAGYCRRKPAAGSKHCKQHAAIERDAPAARADSAVPSSHVSGTDGPSVPSDRADGECVQAPDGTTEPVAWLIRARRPGRRGEWATVDPDDNPWWPMDQGWVTVTRTPLVECGPAENILPERYAVAAPSMSTTSPPENSGTGERVQRLIQAIEGECEGLAITEQHAKAILEYVDGETEGGAKP